MIEPTTRKPLHSAGVVPDAESHAGPQSAPARPVSDPAFAAESAFSEFSDRVPKMLGADVEVANFVLGLQHPDGTGRQASKALLREIPGSSQTSSSSSNWTGNQCNCINCQNRRREQQSNSLYQDNDSGGGSSGGFNPQDWGRKYLAANGGCCYIDLDHLELCIPEVTSAFDFVAAWHAMLRIARKAQVATNARLKDGYRVQVLINNTDGLGNSYGSHLSALLARRTYDNIFHRKMHHMLFLAAYQASSLVFTGQGKVGSENGLPPVDYQIAQRADFFETLSGVQTTFRRPVVNSRDEALCGRSHHSYSYSVFAQENSDPELARLHVIFYDSTLCHVATLLKVGVLQIILAMLEAERIRPEFILDDPLEAIQAWSRDPSLQARAKMANGERMTAVALQQKFLAEARQFHEEGGCEGIVPRAGEILDLWEDTLQKLAARDFDALSHRLDWVLKMRLLQRAIGQNAALTWQSPQLKHLDHLYSSLDSSEGLYWAYERSGLVEQVVSSDEIDTRVAEPPEDTRAWTRAMLLRAAGPQQVDNVDWDTMRFKVEGSRGWPSYPTVDLDHPLRFTKELAGPIFEQDLPLDEMLEAIRDLGEESSLSEERPVTGNTSANQRPLLPAPVSNGSTSAGNGSGRTDAGTQMARPVDDVAGSVADDGAADEEGGTGN